MSGHECFHSIFSQSQRDSSGPCSSNGSYHSSHMSTSFSFHTPLHQDRHHCLNLISRLAEKHNRRQAHTQPLSIYPPQRHLTNPTSLIQQHQWSSREHQNSTEHAPLLPPPPTPRHHTSSPYVLHKLPHQPPLKGSMDKVVVTDNSNTKTST